MHFALRNFSHGVAIAVAYIKIDREGEREKHHQPLQFY